MRFHAGEYAKAWRGWLLFFGVWTVIGLAIGSQLYLAQSLQGLIVSWAFVVGRTLLNWYLFALLSIPVVWLSRRFRLTRRRFLQTAVIHIVGSCYFSVLWVLLRAWVETWLNPHITFQAVFQHGLAANFFFNWLVYWAVVSVTFAFEYARLVRERELRTAELEARLSRAKLQALQMQLNPHFLFNTLHAISALMHKNIAQADRMISRLSELLRYALESSEEHEVPLRRELHFLERYLDIERARFGERLNVVVRVDPTALDALVPNLILQPVIENAIRHGIEPHAKPGRLEIIVSPSGETLRLEVRDNGAGITTAPEEGVGLSNTRARLRQLYGARHRFEMANLPGEGFAVVLEIPLRKPN